jgi:hypothetical protein
MGRDYKLRISNTTKFEDGYEVSKSKKLDSYDRNKNRRQNKINLNKINIDEINSSLDSDDNVFDGQTDNEVDSEKNSLR